MALYEKIKLEVADGVATITLDDPETRNALSDQLLTELLAALRTVKENDDARVVVLASSHEKVFSAGGNLGGFAADVPTAHKYMATGLFPQVFTELGELGKPSIVAASGHVLAGSLGIALACDLIIANDVGGTGVMGGDANTVHLVGRDGVEDWPTLSKSEVATRLIHRLGEMLAAR